MNCPNCKQQLAISERMGIEIDYCPSCRGVWLDRGELDKLLERSTSFSTDRKRDSFDDDAYRSEEKTPKFRKRKNILGDLFDF